MGISQLDPFIIRIAIGRGRVLTVPDPAEVVLGTIVHFEIHVEEDVPDIDAEIYFTDASAFAWQADKILVPAGTSALRPRRIAATVNEAGDFKYGVRGTTTAELLTIADDDPRLIVLPSSGLRRTVNEAPIPRISAELGRTAR